MCFSVKEKKKKRLFFFFFCSLIFFFLPCLGLQTISLSPCTVKPSEVPGLQATSRDVEISEPLIVLKVRSAGRVAPQMQNLKCVASKSIKPNSTQNFNCEAFWYFTPFFLPEKGKKMWKSYNFSEVNIYIRTYISQNLVYPLSKIRQAISQILILCELFARVHLFAEYFCSKRMVILAMKNPLCHHYFCPGWCRIFIIIQLLNGITHIKIFQSVNVKRIHDALRNLKQLLDFSHWKYTCCYCAVYPLNILIFQKLPCPLPNFCNNLLVEIAIIQTWDLLWL